MITYRHVTNCNVLEIQVQYIKLDKREYYNGKVQHILAAIDTDSAMFPVHEIGRKHLGATSLFGHFLFNGNDCQVVQALLADVRSSSYRPRGRKTVSQKNGGPARPECVSFDFHCRMKTRRLRFGGRSRPEW